MKPPYRILHVIDHLGTGGAQEVIWQLVKYSNRAMFQPEVLTIFGEGYYCEVIRKWKVPVYSLLPEHLDIYYQYFCLHLHFLSRLFLFMSEKRYDLVHCHLLWSIMFATPMAALCRTPVRVNHEQVYDPVRHLKGNEVFVGNRRLRQLSNRLSQHIIAGSDSIRNFLCNDEKVPSEKVSLIYNAVDLERLNPANVPGEREKWRRIWGIPQEAIVVGGIGRLDPQKNFPLFLEVAAEVSVRFPEAVFVIAGDGQDRQALEDLSRHLGIDGKVRFLGFVKELRELYQVMDLLLFPSRFEGTPLTIFGALAMGLPVVASHVDGIAETLKDGKDALLVPPLDKDLFVEAVCRMLQDRQLAKKLALTGQETVRQLYSAEAMVGQVEALYLQLLEER